VPLSTLLLLFLPSVVISETPVYSGCEVDTYYSSLSNNPSRAEIGNLLKSTHRNVLPYTSSREDTWDALTDLDAGTEAGKVQLIYSEAEAVAFIQGESRAWNREHLWPKSHGVGYGGTDFTDIHHLRPADVNVNSARGNKYFSACGVVNGVEDCRSPAHPEAGDSTATDSQVWLPPMNVRGDIARAVFYMELRYYGAGGDPDLQLTDCPTSVSDNKLAYLSQLLQWHKEDPVDQAERERNQRACGRWQGNRNIFVDFPELASSIYGDPEPPNGSSGYQCNITTGTPPPSISPVDEIACNDLQAGDVQIIGVHGDFPDEIALVALQDLPDDLELFLTDDAWTGNGFRGSEGTEKVRLDNCFACLCLDDFNKKTMTDFPSAIYSFQFRPAELRKEPSLDLDLNLVYHIAIVGHQYREV
jgi:endonuclease I